MGVCVCVCVSSLRRLSDSLFVSLSVRLSFCLSCSTGPKVTLCLWFPLPGLLACLFLFILILHGGSLKGYGYRDRKSTEDMFYTINISDVPLIKCLCVCVCVFYRHFRAHIGLINGRVDFWGEMAGPSDLAVFSPTGQLPEPRTLSGKHGLTDGKGKDTFYPLINGC